jgi:hypothetical protein
MMSRLIRLCTKATVLIAFLVPAASAAQTPTPPVAKLLVTVVDPSGGVIPGATVTIVGVEASNKDARIDPVKTTEGGLAAVEKLAPGRYTIRAEFSGFQPAELKDQRLRAGENKHVLILPLRRVEDAVVVGRDARDVATDRTLTFGSVLTREQIQALSDDPDEMRRQLMDLAGPDAIIKVDSFEGQQLPPKAQIKSIRISRDQFAAENHGMSHMIDIVTQPGIGPLRTSFRGNFYDSSLDGKNPLVAARGPGQNRGFGGTLGGTLKKDRADFSISVNGSNNWSTPQLYAATSGGTQARNLDIRMPSVNTNVSGLLNYAVTKDQTIRLGFNASEGELKNRGIGQYELIERAYSTESRAWGVRFQEVGPLGRRFVTNTRFMLNVNRSETESAFEGPTIVVQDAFTSGGAQRKGGSENRTFSFNQDLDYVRGLHSFRGGLMVDGGYSGTTTSTNYLGTYTFESLAAYEEGRPRSYSRRVGDPTLEYWNVQTALYLQDDWRPRKNLSVSVGLRYSMQMRVEDKLNFAPRAGFTWSPLKSGRMSVRGSWGIFYEWFPMTTYAQTLQTDGTRQREINIINPTFPDPGPLTGTSAPINRYLLEDVKRMPEAKRTSLGVSGSIKRLSMGASYAYSRNRNQLVGENLNAPVNGVRPDPLFANIIRAVPLAESKSHSLSGNIGINLSPTSAAGLMPMPVPTASQPFFSLRRNLFLSTFFGISHNRTNGEGAFSVPATGDLTQEWGPSFGGPWHSSVSLNSGMIKNLGVYIGINAYAGSYYTIRTGFDDNGDLIFNDRPADVGRNTERGATNISMNMSINYNIAFGKQRTSLPPGIMITSQSGVMSAAAMPSVAAPRYRLTLSAYIDNPTNRANYGGYSGVMTSPFFRKPVSVSGVRRVTFNASLSF